MSQLKRLIYIGMPMKITAYTLLFALLLLGGCSAGQAQFVLNRTKQATVNAATDPVTWVPLAGSVVLYATPYDTKITNYFMQHPWTGDHNNAELARAFNGYLTIGTALFVPEKHWEKRAERVILEAVTLRVSRLSSYALETSIQKETPDGSNDGAIGSNHSLPLFTGSALTRRNVEGMDLPEWGSYGLIGVSYLSSTVSALARVEDGGHSFADQLLSASVGNFIGIFFHDLFLLDDNVNLQTSLTPRQTYIGLNFRY